MITEISLKIHLWLQLVPQAALSFSGPELLVRKVLHFGVTAAEPCGCAAAPLKHRLIQTSQEAQTEVNCSFSPSIIFALLQHADTTDTSELPLFSASSF